MNWPTAIKEPFSEATAATIFRFSLYTFAFLLLAVSLPLVARYRDAAAFKENGAIEWIQLGFLVITSMMLWREAYRSVRFQHVLIFLACLSAFAGIREMDAILDNLVPWIGWKIGYAFILYAGFVGYANRKMLKNQFRLYLSSRAFSLLWAGFIVAIPFAQLVGNGMFLQTIMNDDYSRDYRRMIEEIGELTGYGLLLIGSFELILQKRNWL